MKTLLLITLLNTSPPDTIPLTPYFSTDTLYTNQDLRRVNHNNAVKLRQSERHSITSFVIGLVLGAFIAGGVMSVR